MATTNDLKNGMILRIDGELWKVIEFQHVKPGKGGAFVRTKIKSIVQNKVVDKTFNAGTKVDNVNVDRRGMQFLYNSGDEYIFMDLESYEQISLNKSIVDNSKNYLKEGIEVSVGMFENEPLYILLPNSVDLKVVNTEPGDQGNRANSGTKPAKLETGYEINVPLFINQDDIIKVDTTNGEYIAKAK